jgi:site-specific recombinase XerD
MTDDPSKALIPYNHDIHDELWNHLARGFLAHRGGHKDYVHVISQFCEFLGAEVGTLESQSRFLNATRLDAADFFTFLKSLPGIPPRLRRRSPNDDKALLKKSKSLGQTSQWKISNSTLRKKLTLIKSVYRYLVDDGVLTMNPFALIKLPRNDSGSKRPTEMVDFSFVPKLINAPDIRTPKGLRDSAILAAAFGGALRRSEGIKLRLCDVKRIARGHRFQLSLYETKNHKTYEHHEIPVWAGKIIWRYKELRETQGAKPDDILFASTDKRRLGEPLNSSTVYNIFRRYAKRIGLNVWASPHSARATGITKLIDDGYDLLRIMKFSRHACLSSVEVYDKRWKEAQGSVGRELEFGD